MRNGGSHVRLPVVRQVKGRLFAHHQPAGTLRTVGQLGRRAAVGTLHPEGLEVFGTDPAGVGPHLHTVLAVGVHRVLPHVVHVHPGVTPRLHGRVGLYAAEKLQVVRSGLPVGMASRVALGTLGGQHAHAHIVGVVPVKAQRRLPVHRHGVNIVHRIPQRGGDNEQPRHQQEIGAKVVSYDFQ